MKRNCVVIYYEKNGTRWKETKREERGLIICDLDHWREWAKFDRNIDAYARCVPLSLNSSIMYEYVTINPSRTEKLIYKFYGPVRGENNND